ncbi:MAG: alpha/beta hydrolase [Saprospiraceae bacterium]|nr:alpha/beta hydrolase [Saprospiraceae bacterium]
MSLQVHAQDQRDYLHVKDIPYRAESRDSYALERCKLDLYVPNDQDNFATVVWFHGGGIKAGNKHIPEQLRNQGIAVVAANYRLHPRVSAPTYIEDAAAAVAWTFDHIAEYGGSRDLIFVSGHSAGGYLTSMVGLDTTYLLRHGIHPNEIAGLIPYSGHAVTHFTIRTEMGIDWSQPIVDKFAPLYHTRADAPPYIIITGDRDQELFGRYEEVAYQARMLQLVGHTSVRLYELEGYNHGNMPEGGHPILLRSIEEISNSILKE